MPGDLIRVSLGDIVPADARLLEGEPAEIDQSALTGESLPAERKSGEAVFSGSIIRQGESTRWSALRLRIPTSGKRRNWYKRRIPSAIFNVRVYAQVYALAWFLLTDPLKRLAYRIFDPVKSKESIDLTPQIATRVYGPAALTNL